MPAMIDLHLGHEPGKTADIRDKKQAPVFHVISINTTNLLN